MEIALVADAVHPSFDGDALVIDSVHPSFDGDCNSSVSVACATDLSSSISSNSSVSVACATDLSSSISSIQSSTTLTTAIDCLLTVC